MRFYAVWPIFFSVACHGAMPVAPTDGAATTLVDGGSPDGADEAHGANDLAVPISTVSTMGANVEPGGVVFRVWAPHASGATVTGSFPGAPLAMTASAGGFFDAHAMGAQVGDTYKFTLSTDSGDLPRVDPYCRQLAANAGDGCVIVDPSAYGWQSGTFARPSRAASVVYELHVGSFAVPSGQTQGTFVSTRDALDQLADLGVDVIELMPVQDFGSGPMGWGYNPQLYFAPKPSYGSSDDLRALVDRAHQLGIAVWIDTVVNHMDGWNKAPLYCFDGTCSSTAGIYFFGQGPYATTPWGPRPDYTEPRVAQMLVDAAAAWMDEMHGDGFRWDSVSNIRALDGNGSTPGGKDLLVAANDLVHARGGFAVAEDLKGYAAITQTTNAGGFGFDAQWDGFGYTVPAQLALSNDNDRDIGTLAAALTSGYGGDSFARLLFTENHDTVGNGGTRLPNKIDAAAPTSLYARRRSMLGAVMLMTTPGVPMLFMGQEALATGTFANPPAPLAAPDADGLLVRAFYKDLIRLRRNLDGTTGGLVDDHIEVFHQNDTTGKAIGYRRYGASGQDVLIVVNLKNKAYTEYDVGVDDPGPWTIRLNLDSPKYGADFPVGQTGTVTARAGAQEGRAYTLSLQLGAYSAIVLSK